MVGLCVFLPIQIGMEMLYHFYDLKFIVHYFELLYCVEIIVLLWYFARIYNFMQDYQHFQFQRTKKGMTAFFLTAMLALVFNVIIDLLNEFSVFPSIKDLSALTKFCLSNPNLDHIGNIIQWLTRFSYLNQILIAFAIVYLKSKDDLLEGVNKLDALIKGSIFQRYTKSGIKNTIQSREDSDYILNSAGMRLINQSTDETFKNSFTSGDNIRFKSNQ